MRSFVFLFLSLNVAAHAAVRLASPFTSHMVLQRERAVPVWGTAEAGERVSVSFGGQEKSVVADASGKWRVDLDALEASGEGRLFRVSGSETAEPLVLNDVLVGEVWLCSGQSNMVFTVSKSAYKWAGVTNEAQEIAAANYPQIRMFTGEAAKAYEPQARVGGEWRVCSPETVPGFSAIGYFFARDLQKELKVPVGIVTLAYGASCAEAWVRREALAADEKLRPMLEKFDAEVAAFRALPKVSTSEPAEVRSQDINAAAAPKPKAPKDPVQDQHNATVMFNGMIAPVIPYAMRGVLWYQGESITGGAEGVALYPRVQTSLVNDWRALWRQGDFPFYIVQLAGQNQPSNRPEVREAQATVLALKSTGMAVATDIGEEKNVHPYNKQDVGDRLVRIALANAYGKPVEFSGPQYAAMSVEGGAIRLTFSHAAGGLVARDGLLKWFEVAGADGKFVAAEARIDGDSVVVQSADVAEPKAARYAWVNFPDGGHLYNGAGLPAPQFRTNAVK
ncbi:sialate O-acetylesterase [Nibricoccus aquaticus]|uniref:Sialate O-acetylesterase n=1 Tax=Nibricoccus aquaticus TaxID=2576891 RepID=A0A290Q8X8_9BACT|nr:sialate O-acetylesterase [Nibricoccus aquaticus]ATC63640.1 sialate O-acetylesterase [Nibricoccus aquaticus]